MVILLTEVFRPVTACREKCAAQLRYGSVLIALQWVDFVTHEFVWFHVVQSMMPVTCYLFIPAKLRMALMSKYFSEACLLRKHGGIKDEK